MFVTKNSDLYMRYLAKAKYLVVNQPLVEYFQRKDEQVLLNVTNKSNDIDEIIRNPLMIKRLDTNEVFGGKYEGKYII